MKDIPIPDSPFPLLVDLHTDALYEHMRGRKDITQRSDKGHLDLPRMKEGGVNGQVFAVWVSPTELKPGEYCDFALRGADVFDQVCAGCPDAVTPVRTPAGFRQATAAGRIAAVLGVEGGHALEGRLENLDRFYEHGVRVLTLTWCNSNELGDSSSDESQPHKGLSPLGRKAVRRMNELGVIVDVSHSADMTVFDILDTSLSPVIASHSGIRARRDFNRNLTDDEIKAIGTHGGVIGVVFLPYFLREPEDKASVEDVLDCIDHICQLVGPDHAALGSDFDGFEGVLAGLEDVTKMGVISSGLRRRGYPERDIAKIEGLNFLRVWDAVANRAA
ncbi:dipeptidase [candidate division WOR-3 bacterium]|nr:dipeptidase [candidate division WOR-3 bacterium]